MQIAQRIISAEDKNRAMKHELSLKPKLVYVSYINDEAHRWCNNVGGTTCENDAFYGLAISSKPYNNGIKDLINEYTQTPKMQYSDQCIEMTLPNKDCLLSFTDKKIYIWLTAYSCMKRIFGSVNITSECSLLIKYVAKYGLMKEYMLSIKEII